MVSFDQSLLDRSRYFWLGENVGRGLRKMARRFVQPQQGGRRMWGGSLWIEGVRVASRGGR